MSDQRVGSSPGIRTDSSTLPVSRSLSRHVSPSPSTASSTVENVPPTAQETPARRRQFRPKFQVEDFDEPMPV